MKFWRALPVIVRAVILGVAVTSAASFPWSWLAGINLKYGSAFPWSVVLVLPYLWLLWRYLGGTGPPVSTAESRRTNLRACSLAPDIWTMSILSGILASLAIVEFQIVLSKLVALPQEQVPPDLTGVPYSTIVPMIIMGAAVAGFFEEAGFRGYMQGPIERRHGPLAAILVNGILFGFAHFTHPTVTMVLLPYYLAVAAMYGTLAYLTSSIWPGVALHTAGNVFGLLNVLTRGVEWWPTEKAAPVAAVAEPLFWIRVSVLIGLAAATILAYRQLAKVVRDESRASVSG